MDLVIWIAILAIYLISHVLKKRSQPARPSHRSPSDRSRTSEKARGQDSVTFREDTQGQTKKERKEEEISALIRRLGIVELTEEVQTEAPPATLTERQKQEPALEEAFWFSPFGEPVEGVHGVSGEGPPIEIIKKKKPAPPSKEVPAVAEGPLPSGHELLGELRRKMEEKEGTLPQQKQNPMDRDFLFKPLFSHPHTLKDWVIIREILGPPRAITGF